MLTLIQPSGIHGVVRAPRSKSSMQRACAAALLNAGETIINDPGYSNDDKAAIELIRALGARVTGSGDEPLHVIPPASKWGGKPLSVNCGESGLGIRMFAPIMALSGQEITVNGEGSLLSRPMDFFDEVFPQLGIRVGSNKGRLPLKIQGPLQPRTIDIDGSLSSQFLTGLLFAYAGAEARDVSIRVKDLKSKPYIDLTLEVMEHFGWEVGNRDYEEFYFPGSSAAHQGSTGRRAPISYTVEGDWSGAAFLLVAGAIAGRITIVGLDPDSAQADKEILQALRSCGARMLLRPDHIEIGPGSDPLQGFHFDATDCPDLFPPLVALASYCEGTSVIEGVGRLAHKESNRALTLQEEFAKMGVDIRLEGNRMLVRGGEGPDTERVLGGMAVHSHHDHRIAMACAVAGLRAERETMIEEAQAIDKSYPDFYTHLRQLGARVRIWGEINHE
ncbi:MAG: 3-phosphoshikimate 1-carboxyvinyltransferase [Bacteroidota bacterium]|nr:3-phosphoshikimate 1-carboxyvinyltransferase [Bacteroidota bacterium]